MYTEEQYKNKIKELEDKISEIRRYLDSTRQEYAEMYCPFEIGQRLTLKRGRVVEVARIGHKSYTTNPPYTLYGKWVLKDGTLGELEREIYSFDISNEATK